MAKMTLAQEGYDAAVEAAQFLHARGFKARLAITLGSGLDAVVGGLEDLVSIPYQSIPHFPVPSVKGHRGTLELGTWNGVRVAILRGRVHSYEGYSAARIVFPVRTLALAGVETFVFTCAAGGIAPEA